MRRKIQAYFKAKKAVDNGATIKDACEGANIAIMTFYKYKKLFGDNEPNERGLVEVVPQERSQETSSARGLSATKELDMILKENAALQKQLELRKELLKYVQ